MGSFFLYQYNKSRHQQVKNQLLTSSENISSQVSFFYHTARHELETASQQVERIAQKNYQQHQLLNTLKNNNPAFSSLAFFDINGIVKSSVCIDKNYDAKQLFIENSTLFSFPYNTGKSYIIPLTSLDNLPAIGMSHPVFFLDRAYIIGVISAIVPLNSIQPILERSTLPENLNILVLDNEGRVLAEKLQGMASHTSFPLTMDWQEDVVIDHIRYISYVNSFDFYGQHFSVIATINAEKSIEPSAKSFMLLAFLILLLLLISVFVAMTTNTKIIEPLQILAEKSSTMAQGKDVDLHLSEDAELQDLGKALQTMNKQLHNSNTSLEKEVYKRRRQERNAILAKIEAERSNQAKSIFLANMSHEIRTPLHGMLGMLKMLENDPLSSEQTKLLAMTSMAGERLQGVVNTILDISQIESGKFQLRSSSFSLGDLLSEVVELMTIQGREKGIRIRSKKQKAIPDMLQGDSGRIRQILINLINNSIKFTDQGIISIKAELLPGKIDGELKLLFSISDCGKGISEKDQQTIFSAFERGGLESEYATEGTGLGLAISSEFVQHMGGKLWLESTGPDGSIFCFTIRCAPAPPQSFPEDKIKLDRTRHPLAGVRIMLAEDEFINQRIISAYLEEQGGHVTVCQHGRELLNKMQQEAADIILMDIRMPVMNGLEATEHIRKLEADSALLPIPIVALTAQATTEFEEKCKTAGMNNYLTKPVPLDKLVKIICDLVRK